MPGQRPTIQEEPYPPHVEFLKREAIRKSNTAGNYQPGELAGTGLLPQPSLAKLMWGDGW